MSELRAFLLMLAILFAAPLGLMVAGRAGVDIRGGGESGGGFR